MTLRDLQYRAVDTIKRHALTMSLDSPRAQAAILTEYLWVEEGAESPALDRTVIGRAPEWLDKLVARQLADERRHAGLLRHRLTELGAGEIHPPPALMRAKLWWIERASASFAGDFAAGPIVVALAVVGQLEATGVRMFRRHLAVLEGRAATDPTAAIVRSILADEQRHAKSCAAAAARLVGDDEQARFDELRERIATIDRAFGVTIAIGFWILVAAQALRDLGRSS